MILKNSLKIAISRSGLITKTLLFDILSFLIFAIIGAAIVMPQFNQMVAQINELNVVQKFYDAVKEVANLAAGATETVAVDALISSIRQAVDIFFSSFVSKAYFVSFGVFLIIRLIVNLKTVPLGDIIHSFMSANSEYGFVANFVHNHRRSFYYSLIYSLFSIPFDALLFFYILYGVRVTVGVFGLLSPFFIVLIVTALLAFKSTVFFSWLPQAITTGNGMFRSFFDGLKFTFAHFGRVFSISLTFSIFTFGIAVVLGLATFGVALLVLLPFFNILKQSMEMAVYYEYNGMRYYSEYNVIVEPGNSIK